MKFLHTALALALAAPVSAAPATTLQDMLAQPQHKAMVSFKAMVVEDQGRNKFLVEDGGRRIEVKAGPDWHHTVGLPMKQALTFQGELRAKDKHGERKLEVELYRVTRADGAVLVIREAGGKPWGGKDKHSGKPPVRLEWKRA